MAGLRLPRRVTQPRATNDLLGTFADGGAQEARSAVAAARRTFDSTARSAIATGVRQRCTNWPTGSGTARTN
ncbi:hypothetical protein [Streptomyces sp. G-5]|uniref:hypothetical protein n=1 Tax=Streptomyces sp. G-5 TaxID=2977231 RepID=UPI0021D361AE|nr:hypothetical protein [Streptomyces sp. G-5]MCU4749928.1 hypothetical protein [Streptomyces sp. G-5]